VSSRRQSGVTCNVLRYIEYTRSPLAYNIYKALTNLGSILDNRNPNSEEEIYDIALGYLQGQLDRTYQIKPTVNRSFRGMPGPDLLIERPSTLLYGAQRVCVEFKFDRGYLDYDGRDLNPKPLH